MNAKKKSRWTRPAVAATAVGAVVAALTTGTAGSASAKDWPLSLKYTCAYPIIHKQALTIDITASIPEVQTPNKPSGSFPVKAVAHLDAKTMSGLDLIGAVSIEGSATATATIKSPGQADTVIHPELTFDKTAIPEKQQAFDVKAHGMTPSVTIKGKEGDKSQVFVNDLWLKVVAIDGDGYTIDLGTQPDGTNLDHVVCTQDTGQNNLLATITAGSPDGGVPDTTAPTVPANVKAVGSADGKSVGLSWDPSTDPKDSDGSAGSGVAGYEVYDKAGKKVADVTDPKATITGLTPGTEYAFTVKAKDKLGNVSAASAAVKVTTGGAGGNDTTAPSVPANVKAAGSADGKSVELSWDPSTDPKDSDGSAGTGVAGYEVYDQAGKKVADVTDAKATVTGLTPGGSYAFSVKAKDKAGNVSAASAAVKITTAGAGDTTAPGVPVNVKAVGSADGKSVDLSWDPSADPKNADGSAGSGVAGYEVYDKAGKKVADVTDAKATVTGLTPGTEYAFTVKAKDKAGNVSAASSAVQVTTGPAADTVAPSAPANVVATPAPTSVSLTWDKSTDNVAVTGYEVYDSSGKKVADVTATSATLNGLAPDTDYTVTVKAKDKAGNLSAASAPLKFHTGKESTGGEGGEYAFNVNGSTFLKAPNGTAPLTGGLVASIDGATKKYTGDLTLNPTTGDFKIFGFLPVRAGIVMTPQGKVTGTLDGKLVADVNVKVGLPSLSFFGIPLAGGEQCTTRTPSALHLESAGAFDPVKGSKISGKYKLDELEGCEGLAPLLSAFTAGDGNTIDLNLTGR
ncbi:Exoglucanase B precursor [Actinomadura rubteroloni]|uniref:Exoglucanase B n=1 Tax=Actinomadura rubteroloni TaxID=1926885 RepID=A0A2P4ULB0_9ACTN|nr:fibronectin type III domain-containing protein [Actinomadura rubteroloni]POM25831.1 Exoglucanase B precursor [Actinomadura rubteroloni]